MLRVVTVPPTHQSSLGVHFVTAGRDGIGYGQAMTPPDARTTNTYTGRLIPAEPNVLTDDATTAERQREGGGAASTRDVR
jgi:hypothetical protein